MNSIPVGNKKLNIDFKERLPDNLQLIDLFSNNFIAIYKIVTYQSRSSVEIKNNFK
jgi:hypothetical protein